MANRRQMTVAVIFGGRSVEHDVSIVTAQQIMHAFDDRRYQVVPVYISRDGKWYTGDPLRNIDNFKEDTILDHADVHAAILSPDVRHHGLIVNPLAGRFSKSEIIRLDLAFPAIHGSHGEDGTLQGLFELADIPYVGFATLGSALTNDKIMTKHVLRQHGIDVVDGVAFHREDWLNDADDVIARIEAQLDYPVFIKPATLGSSIGVTRADDASLLRAGIDIAANFDRRILVETGITDGVEINCAVMGYGDELQVSVLEQPLSWGDFLAFEDKYLSGNEGMKSADRIIPAPIDDTLAQDIQAIARQAFTAVDGRGIVRIDFLVRPEQGTIYLNELNTMPGSLSFYLWRETGIHDRDVVDKLVDYARRAHADKRRNMYDYQTNLVNVAAGRGIKGAKGAKSSPVQSNSSN
jgi:D-alanine-D-alanine ligase